uniref:CSON002763 protein n=1 Tax=Culicoides sonorensis TaxID=179676 RepID=A0A336MXT6_CULSO
MSIKIFGVFYPIYIILEICVIAVTVVQPKLFCFPKQYQKRVDSVLWPCRDNLDCNSIVANAKCSQYNYCYCPAGYIFSSDVTECLKESAHGVACKDPVQCSHMLSGAICNNGSCDCADGYTYARGKCRKLAHLDSACSEDIDCAFGADRESVVCRDKVCSCSDGYYRRASNVCRRLSTKPGDPCLVQSDCQSQDLSLVCEKQTCVNGTSTGGENSPSSGISSSKTNLRDIGTQISISSFKNDNPLSDDINYKRLRTVSTATSDSNNHKNSLSSYESSMRDEIGDPCTSEGDPCPGLDHSVCRKALCHCQYGYYEKQGLCHAELGEHTMHKEFCPANTRYENNRCLCPYNTFYSPNMRFCVKPTINFEGSCVYNEQCSVYGAAYCPKDAPKKTCQCHAYATYNKEKELCELKEGLGEYCELDSMCSIPNTRCNEHKSCVCKENYVERDGKCMPGIGASCGSPDEMCALENSECVSNGKRNSKYSIDQSEGQKYCSCKKQYVHAQGECLKKATKYEDECKANEQCTPLLGDLSKCINRTCKCEIIHHHKDDRCYEKVPLNAPCERSSECFVESEPDTVECRNSECKCKVDHTPDVEAQVCIKPRPTKNSSNKISPLKAVTWLLFSLAALTTISAIREAYYP